MASNIDPPTSTADQPATVKTLLKSTSDCTLVPHAGGLFACNIDGLECEHLADGAFKNTCYQLLHLVINHKLTMDQLLKMGWFKPEQGLSFLKGSWVGDRKVKSAADVRKTLKTTAGTLGWYIDRLSEDPAWGLLPILPRGGMKSFFPLLSLEAIFKAAQPTAAKLNEQSQSEMIHEMLEALSDSTDCLALRFPRIFSTLGLMVEIKTKQIAKANNMLSKDGTVSEEHRKALQLLVAAWAKDVPVQDVGIRLSKQSVCLS
jgi:hypothetical protein